MNRVVAGLILLVAIFGGVYYYFFSKIPVEEVVSVVETPEPMPQVELIGKSVEGREIEGFSFGKGEKHLLFVGGIHGGYEWNSVLLAYEFIDYLTEHKDELVNNQRITIIPNLNPDGVHKVIGKEGRFTREEALASTVENSLGRFNKNGVDLNRNFDCKWKPESTWRSRKVSAGSAPFSEPEALALKNFVEKEKPSAVVFWHSQANAVYASECENGILPVTRDIMNAYSKASGYKAIDVFNAYPVTGDAEGWLASIGIPAITVELATHEDIEWEKNLAGFKALVQYYSSNNQ